MLATTRASTCSVRCAQSAGSAPVAPCTIAASTATIGSATRIAATEGPARGGDCAFTVVPREPASMPAGAIDQHHGRGLRLADEADVDGVRIERAPGLYLRQRVDAGIGRELEVDRGEALLDRG